MTGNNQRQFLYIKRLRMFANDTNLTFKAETVRELEHEVNRDLENITESMADCPAISFLSI